MSTGLNPAERAAAEALWNHWTPVDGDPELTIESFYDEARAAVAAVRGPLYREAADRIRQDWPKSPHISQKLWRLAAEADSSNTEPEYQCPDCDHWAPWTDGLSMEAGDSRDEFWCQRCGAESPLWKCLMRAAERQAEGSGA